MIKAAIREFKKLTRISLKKNIRKTIDVILLTGFGLILIYLADSAGRFILQKLIIRG